jgi:hypothetical protein
LDPGPDWVDKLVALYLGETGNLAGLAQGAGLLPASYRYSSDPMGGAGPVGSISDPDWIRIQSGQWIRIRIQNPDPVPGGVKITQKN